MADTIVGNTVKPSRPSWDWTRDDYPANKLSSFQKFTKEVDWSATPVGPMASWPAQLRSMTLLVMADPSPSIIYWGDPARPTMVHNEAYTGLIGNKHPGLQGQNPWIGFAEVWDQFDRILKHGVETGETTVGGREFLLLERHGWLEETYFTWKFIPIVGPDGQISGSYATVTEATREVIADRRTLSIQKLSSNLATATDLKAVWAAVIAGLTTNEYDAPLALLYAVDDASKGSFDGKACVLESAVGIEAGHTIAPAHMEIESSSDGFAPFLRQAAKADGPLIIQVCNGGGISPELLRGIEWRGYGVQCTNFVICTIRAGSSAIPLGYLITALNPRRPWDEDYSGWFTTIVSAITTPNVSAVLLREAVKAGQAAATQAALAHERLTEELEAAEANFSRFAGRAPIGVGVVDPAGALLFANPVWYGLVGMKEGESEAMAWIDAVHEEDRDYCLKMWARLSIEKTTISQSLRLRTPWKAPTGETLPTTVLCASYPDLDSAGEVKTVMTCVINISEQQWTNDQLRLRIDEALAMKKKQEMFIDMTSHEIRNPLSAVVTCIEEIITCLTEYRAKPSRELDRNLPHKVEQDKNEPTNGNALEDASIESALDAAHTIDSCVQHMKNIVNDVLTLSKLDSQLLMISPAVVRPVQAVQNALKMFEGELRAAKIQLELRRDPSFQELRIDTLVFDPSRVLQVLINLLTNSIKFTRTEPKRSIVVSLSASTEDPSKDPGDIEWVPIREGFTKVAFPAEWEASEDLYLIISVRDTGRGLEKDERALIFDRFTQANPKTESQYGGSGLGLYICRNLTEMQSGRIGLKSLPRKGSTFVFTTLTKRATGSNKLTTDASLPVRMRLVSAASHDRSTSGLNVATNEQLAKTAAVAKTKSSSTSRRVLVVEDNLVNQKVLAKQLRKRGYFVSTANNGAEAIEEVLRASSEPFQIALMDIEMPVMGGLDCVRKLRHLEETGALPGHLPVIAVTANVRSEHIAHAIAAGMDDVTTKPYKFEEIVRQVEDADNITKTTSTMPSSSEPC